MSGARSDRVDRRAPALQAVLWDMDGLLVDSEPVWSVAELELVQRLGGVWSDDLKTQIVGTRMEVSVPRILRWHDVEPSAQRVEETTAWLLARMVKLFAAGLPAQPGAEELLAELRNAGVPVALVSSSYRVLVDAVLAQGLGPFETTLAGDEVVCAKPHPEPYLTACARLRVDPGRCVVLEDSPTGAASGVAAGCAVVVVPSVPGTSVPTGARTWLRDSLRGLGLGDLQALASIG